MFVKRIARIPSLMTDVMRVMLLMNHSALPAFLRSLKLNIISSVGIAVISK